MAPSQAQRALTSPASLPVANVGRLCFVRLCSQSPEGLGRDEKGEGPLRESTVIQVWNWLVWVVFGGTCCLYGLLWDFWKGLFFFAEE